jgi:hypothetical protein
MTRPTHLNGDDSGVVHLREFIAALAAVVLGGCQVSADIVEPEDAGVMCCCCCCCLLVT